MGLDILSLLDRPDCLNPESQREIIRLASIKGNDVSIITIIVYLLERVSQLETELGILENRVRFK